MSDTDSKNIASADTSLESKHEETHIEKRHQNDDEIDCSINKKFKKDDDDVSSHDRDGPSSTAIETLKRKKVAMLLAYSGQGYYGMQRNKHVNTIEEDLLTAMLKAGLISRENYEVPQTMHFQRAARTDKGVSAARQVVSLRIAIIDNLIEKINTLLPDQIRVFDIKRGTKGFNSKLWCDARSYSYTLPTFAFATATEVTNINYRITDEVIERVNEILNDFKGTHNFHNFTSGKKPGDASAYRYIIDFQCGKPFFVDDLELIVITVKGQSFMLHQIRKMIGVVIAIMRDLASRDLIKKAYSAEKVDIPIAPGVGLVLEEAHYDKYNQRYGSDGIHEIMEWSNHLEKIKQFKKDYIYPTIVKAEKEEQSLFQWLSTLPLHTYGVREVGTNIPSERSQTRSELGRALVLTELSSSDSQNSCPQSDGNETNDVKSSFEKTDKSETEGAIESPQVSSDDGDRSLSNCSSTAICNGTERT